MGKYHKNYWMPSLVMAGLDGVTIPSTTRTKSKLLTSGIRRAEAAS